MPGSSAVGIAFRDELAQHGRLRLLARTIIQEAKEVADRVHFVIGCLAGGEPQSQFEHSHRFAQSGDLGLLRLLELIFELLFDGRIFLVADSGRKAVQVDFGYGDRVERVFSRLAGFRECFRQRLVAARGGGGDTEFGEQLLGVLLSVSRRAGDELGQLAGIAHQLGDLRILGLGDLDLVGHRLVGPGYGQPQSLELGGTHFRRVGLFHPRRGLDQHFAVFLLRVMHPTVDGQQHDFRSQFVEVAGLFRILQQFLVIADRFLEIAHVLVATALVHAGVESRDPLAILVVQVAVFLRGGGQRVLVFLARLVHRVGRFFEHGGREQFGLQIVGPHLIALLVPLWILLLIDVLRQLLELRLQIRAEGLERLVGGLVERLRVGAKLVLARLRGPLDPFHLQVAAFHQEIAELAFRGERHRMVRLVGDELIERLLGGVELLFTEGEIFLVTGPLHQRDAAFVGQRFLHGDRGERAVRHLVDVVDRHVVVVGFPERLQEFPDGLAGRELAAVEKPSSHARRESDPARQNPDETAELQRTAHVTVSFAKIADENRPPPKK